MEHGTYIYRIPTIYYVHQQSKRKLLTNISRQLNLPQLSMHLAVQKGFNIPSGTITLLMVHWQIRTTYFSCCLSGWWRHHLTWNLYISIRTTYFSCCLSGWWCWTTSSGTRTEATTTGSSSTINLKWATKNLQVMINTYLYQGWSRNTHPT